MWIEFQPWLQLAGVRHCCVCCISLGCSITLPSCFCINQRSDREKIDDLSLLVSTLVTRWLPFFSELPNTNMYLRAQTHWKYTLKHRQHTSSRGPRLGSLPLNLVFNGVWWDTLDLSFFLIYLSFSQSHFKVRANEIQKHFTCDIIFFPYLSGCLCLSLCLAGGWQWRTNLVEVWEWAVFY